MNQSLLDHELVRLEAFEPAGTAIELSARDLLGHTLVLGGTGAGKTTCVIQPILNQLIQSSVEPGIGLCILDTKSDGEAQAFLQAAVFAVDRDRDLSMIAVDSDYCLDLLEPLRTESLEGASRLAETLSYLVPECSTNRFWEVTFRSLLRHTFRLFLLLGHEIKYSEFVGFIADYLLRFDTDEGSFKGLETLLETLHEDGTIDAPKEVVHETRSMHMMWEKLDWRTRTNLQSMAAPLVGLLNQSAAKRLFSEGTPICLAGAVNTGGIVLLSIDSIREPEVARLAGTLFKARYYDAILGRRIGAMNPLSVLIMDDWVQSASQGTGTRYSDADALSIMRSRHGCIVSAAQGLAGLDLAIGPYSRKAVLANFANLFFFRSRDSELDAIAAAYLGQKVETLKDSAVYEKGLAALRRQAPVEYHREIRVPAVPQGALARLPTGEAYALIGGQSYNQPISFIPHHAIQEQE